MKKLSKVVMAFMLFGFVSINAVNAQDLTDQDYKDYAIILMAQKAITDKISPYVNDLIEKQEGIDGNRYAELDAIAKGDATKLPAATPTEQFEQTFYATIQKRVETRKKAAGTVVNNLAKYSLGAKKYNAVKKAYSSGGDAKAKIDGITDSLATE